MKSMLMQHKFYRQTMLNALSATNGPLRGEFILVKSMELVTKERETEKCFIDGISSLRV